MASPRATLSEADLQARLRDHLEDADQIDLSQVEFINLDDIKEVCGENWPEWRSRIFVASESIIDKHTGNADLVIRCDSGFIVIFAECSEAQVIGISAKVQAELREFFLGKPETERLNIDVEAARVTPKDFAERLSKARTAPRNDDVEDDETSLASHKTYDDNITFPDVPAARISIRFEPVWSAKAQAVGTFFCVPYIRRGTQPFMTGFEFLGDDPTPSEAENLNLIVIKRAVHALASLAQGGSLCAIAVALHYKALMSARTRIPLMKEISAIPKEYRRFFIIRIDGAPADAPASQLDEVTRLVAPFAGQVFVHRPLKLMKYDRYRDAKIDVIGLTVPEGHTHIDKFENALIVQVEDAQRFKREICLDNCAHFPIIQQAYARGVHFFSGDAIGRPIGFPSAPYRLGWEELTERNDVNAYIE